MITNKIKLYSLFRFLVDEILHPVKFLFLTKLSFKTEDTFEFIFFLIKTVFNYRIETKLPQSKLVLCTGVSCRTINELHTIQTFTVSLGA